MADRITVTLAVGHNDYTWHPVDLTVRARRDDETEAEYIEKITSTWLAAHQDVADVAFVTVYAYSDAD